MKTCSKCKIEKPFEDFYAAKGYADGYTGQCKPCRRAVSRKYKRSPRGKANSLAYSRTEKRKKAQAEYQNSEHYRSIRKSATKKYEASEKGVNIRAKGRHNRRARLADTTSDNWQASEVFESANWQCFYCGIDVELRQDPKAYQTNEAHADHFIPLSNGGTNERKNIVCSCGQCNLSKGSKNPFEFIRDNINQIGGEADGN